MNEQTPTTTEQTPTFTPDELAAMNARAQADSGLATRALRDLSEYTLSPDGVVMTPAEVQEARNPDTSRERIGRR